MIFKRYLRIPDKPRPIWLIPAQMTSKKIAQLQELVQGDRKYESDQESEEESTTIKPRTVQHKTGEQGYRKMDQRSHVLHRPDTYIGSTTRNKSSGRMWIKEGQRFRCREAYFTEGLLRIFMEPMSNAIDNIWRSEQFKVPARLIKIVIDKTSGVISIWNDGVSISLAKFKDEETGIVSNNWTPEEIFGELLTSSNYDDEEKRKTSGRNGIGIKACNIFSSWFEVEIYNPNYGTIYRQRWTENMLNKEPPVWDRDKSHFPRDEGKTGYTLIRFKPDYSRFGYSSGLDNDMFAVLEKGIYDYALIAALNGVRMIYNGELLPVADFKTYVNLYYDSPPEEALQLKSDDCSVIIAPKADPLYKGDLMHVAFMNGILTKKGGVHVDAWDEAIFRPIVNKINKVKPEREVKAKKETKGVKKKKTKSASKRPTIDISHVRKYFSLFIVAEADNPTFSEQNKETYSGPPIHTRFRPVDLSKLMKWSFVERIEESIKLREFSALKDAGKKKRNYMRIDNLEDANFAGDAKLGRECILTATEGDSAASYVAVGMKYGIEGKIGQDYIGTFSLRGKGLNARKAPVNQIVKNKELIGMIRALGLEYGVDYSDLRNRSKLRYGKFYVIADGDADGCLAEGTPINLPCGVSVPIEQTDHVKKCIAWNEAQDGLIVAEMTKFMDKGMKHAVEVLFEDGRKLRLTPDHQLCTSEGKWVEAKDAEGLSFKMAGIYPLLDYEESKSSWQLEVGDLTFKMDSKDEINRTLAFCRILGMFLSDGHFGSTICELYVGQTSDLRSVIADAQLFINPEEIKVYEPSEAKPMWAVRFRMNICHALTSLPGVLKGKRVDQEAALPEFLFTNDCPRIVIREFLGGLFGGDGVAPYLCKYKMRHSKQQSYKFSGLGFVQSKEPAHLESLFKMMERLGQLLEYFDIHPTVKQTHRNRKDKSICVKLFIPTDDYLKFANHIGFRHCVHKSHRLACIQSYYRLYNLVRKQRCVMIKRGLELRSEGMIIRDACEQSIQEFEEKHTIIHPASLLKEGNLKSCTRDHKIFKNLRLSGFDDPLTYLRKIGAVNLFISEEDLETDRNRQGTSHYGIPQHQDWLPCMNLKAISVRELKRKRHVYDLSVETPYHSFIASGIVAHNCHIVGLTLNALDALFPSLLDANDFFHFMRIPIVKVNMKSERLVFLYYYSAQKFLEENKVPNPKKNVKYFKGLGTAESKDVEEDFGRYPVALMMTDKGRDLLSKVFGDDTDFRKNWLLEHENAIKQRIVPDYQVEELNVEQFLNEEMRLYSIDSCERAIGCIVDGLKRSTRKVLSACIKRKLNYNGQTLKVVQLAGYVAEHMGYHHGEQNLPDIIIGMAQSFVGSNNIPLLYASGFFGTRQGGGPNLSVGKDAAAGRYIYTKLDMLTRLIFRPEDDVYLPDRVEEGDTIEKEYFMPIVPMILINGCAGIGTGSSTNIPMYNVLELIDWIHTWLNRNGQIKSQSSKGLTFYDTPELVPFYRGFEGKIEQEAGKITTYGNLAEIKTDTWHITELPLGHFNVSIKKYRAKLEKMRELKQIKSIKSQKHDENKPDFTITVDEDGIKPTHKNMKLVDTMSTSNMVLFDEHYKLQKYPDIESILEYYCQRRLTFYKIRREGNLAALKLEIKWVSNKIRFIRAVDAGELSIRDRDEADLDRDLDNRKFNRKPRGKSKHAIIADTEDDSEEVETKEDLRDEIKTDISSFDYLLSMQLRTLNIRSKVFKTLEKEHDKLEQQIRDLESMTPEGIWRNELDELKDGYNKWEKTMIKGTGKKPKSKSEQKRAVK